MTEQLGFQPGPAEVTVQHDEPSVTRAWQTPDDATENMHRAADAMAARANANDTRPDGGQREGATKSPPTDSPSSVEGSSDTPAAAEGGGGVRPPSVPPAAGADPNDPNDPDDPTRRLAAAVTLAENPDRDAREAAVEAVYARTYGEERRAAGAEGRQPRRIDAQERAEQQVSAAQLAAFREAQAAGTLTARAVEQNMDVVAGAIKREAADVLRRLQEEHRYSDETRELQTMLTTLMGVDEHGGRVSESLLPSLSIDPEAADAWRQSISRVVPLASGDAAPGNAESPASKVRYQGRYLDAEARRRLGLDPTDFPSQLTGAQVRRLLGSVCEEIIETFPDHAVPAPLADEPAEAEPEVDETLAEAHAPRPDELADALGETPARHSLENEPDSATVTGASATRRFRLRSEYERDPRRAPAIPGEVIAVADEVIGPLSPNRHASARAGERIKSETQDLVEKLRWVDERARQLDQGEQVTADAGDPAATVTEGFLDRLDPEQVSRLGATQLEQADALLRAVIAERNRPLRDQMTRRVAVRRGITDPSAAEDLLGVANLAMADAIASFRTDTQAGQSRFEAMATDNGVFARAFQKALVTELRRLDAAPSVKVTREESKTAYHLNRLIKEENLSVRDAVKELVGYPELDGVAPEQQRLASKIRRDLEKLTGGVRRRSEQAAEVLANLHQYASLTPQAVLEHAELGRKVDQLNEQTKNAHRLLGLTYDLAAFQPEWTPDDAQPEPLHLPEPVEAYAETRPADTEAIQLVSDLPVIWELVERALPTVDVADGPEKRARALRDLRVTALLIDPATDIATSDPDRSVGERMAENAAKAQATDDRSADSGRRTLTHKAIAALVNAAGGLRVNPEEVKWVKRRLVEKLSSHSRRFLAAGVVAKPSDAGDDPEILMTGIRARLERMIGRAQQVLTEPIQATTLPRFFDDLLHELAAVVRNPHGEPRTTEDTLALADRTSALVRQAVRNPLRHPPRGNRLEEIEGLPRHGDQVRLLADLLEQQLPALESLDRDPRFATTLATAKQAARQLRAAVDATEAYGAAVVRSREVSREAGRAAYHGELHQAVRAARERHEPSEPRTSPPPVLSPAQRIAAEAEIAVPAVAERWGAAVEEPGKRLADALNDCVAFARRRGVSGASYVLEPTDFAL